MSLNERDSGLGEYEDSGRMQDAKIRFQFSRTRSRLGLGLEFEKSISFLLLPLSSYSLCIFRPSWNAMILFLNAHQNINKTIPTSLKLRQTWIKFVGPELAPLRPSSSHIPHHRLIQQHLCIWYLVYYQGTSHHSDPLSIASNSRFLSLIYLSSSFDSVFDTSTDTVDDQACIIPSNITSRIPLQELRRQLR